MHEYEYNERIMGTDLSVSIIAENEILASEIFADTFLRLKSFETQFSRFLPESELTHLNNEQSLVVSPLFISLLHIARALYMRTDGYFNPLLQIDRLGYTQSFEQIKNSIQKPIILPYNTNLNMVIIDEQTRRVTLAPDQKLDFGGFLKGYLAEQEAKRVMNEYPINGIIVNIGGDIHTRGRDENGHVFIFSIYNPFSMSGVSLPLENASLATSGTYKRKWNTGTETMHHILARSGIENPKNGIISASVVHQDGATAEAYAKALLTVDPDICFEMVGETFTYILISDNGAVHTSL